jgi:dTDP-4-dehydrorhamnose reductase
LKILLTGVSGQIGADLVQALQHDAELIPVTRAQMDLEDFNQIREVIRAVKPALIIHPAAYTSVVNAENAILRAQRSNADSVGIIAQEAAMLDACVISFSTDYVFDGHAKEPYTELAPTAPLNVYGQTKLAGEEAIRHNCAAHWIIRTSWVYSAQHHNFLRTIIRLALEKETFTVVDDQIGAPTWSHRISHVCKAMLTGSHGTLDLQQIHAHPGTYHLSAAGSTSWYQYAVYIVETLQTFGVKLKINNSAAIIPISTDPSIKPQRPKNSRLNCEKLINTFGIALPQWQADVRTCLTHILQQPNFPSD